MAQGISESERPGKAWRDLERLGESLEAGCRTERVNRRMDGKDTDGRSDGRSGQNYGLFWNSYCLFIMRQAHYAL